MILLSYALWLGPENWPLTVVYSYGMLLEMSTEGVALRSLAILKTVQLFRR